MLSGIAPALFGAPAAAAGNDAFTKLLMHADGNNNDWSFYDCSLTSHGFADTNGSPLVSTAQKKIGSASALFNGSSSIAWPNNADWEFGTGNFTIDWWEYRTSGAAGAVAISRDATTTYSPFLLGYYASGIRQVYMASADGAWGIANAKTLGAATLNVWTHLAVVRNGTTFYCFRDGVQTDTWTSAAAFRANSNPLSIGVGQSTGYFTGYIDELRISKGIARWTANFTPPTVAYAPAVTPPAQPQTTTRVLLHLDTNQTDSASGVKGNGTHTWTLPAGSIGTPAKFGAGALNNGVVTCPAHADFVLSSGAFTIDFWLNCSDYTVPVTAIAGQSNTAGGPNNGWKFQSQGSAVKTSISFFLSANGSAETTLFCGEIINNSTWAHVAAVRSGNTLYGFLDGVLGGTVAFSGSVFNSTTTLSFGRWGVGDGTPNWNGSIDECRLTIGKALWTAAFTPPTAPGSP